MKILYSVQATGNGHISRAMELLPYLERHGKVDIFLSGANSTLQIDAPVRFRSKGLCLFYSQSGGLSYWKMARHFQPLRVLREARDLPVQDYDLVINDFESITALACSIKKVPSINFGHQASFQSEKTPRPAKREFMGEWILHHYGAASQYLGLHFRSYDDFILPPVIKKEVLDACPGDEGHITVYLSSYSDRELEKHFLPLSPQRFEVFSKEVQQPVRNENIRFIPVSNRAFTQSMIGARAVITGAGFETPAEALYLQKKLMVIPIEGQYEQKCNAAALEQLGVMQVPRLDAGFSRVFEAWMRDYRPVGLSLSHSTREIVEFLFDHCAGSVRYRPLYRPDFVF